MLLRRLEDCDEFIAGDMTRLREILHPDKMEIDIHYSLAHAILPPGKASQPHYLHSSEVYYILSGKGCMHINGQVEEAVPGTTIYIPPRSIQFIENTGKDDLVFLCIVNPPWRKENEFVI